MRYYGVVFFSIFMIVNGYAKSGAWQSSSLIPNFTATITQLAQQTKLPIIFPKQVPLNKNRYYANSEIIANNSYAIYLDSASAEAQCKGAHYCNLITLMAQSNKTPQIYYNAQHQKVTTIVTLNNKQTAYYTGGFALADYWNPSIAWQNQGVLYTLTWVGLPDPAKTKVQLLRMANAIKTYVPGQP